MNRIFKIVSLFLTIFFSVQLQAQVKKQPVKKPVITAKKTIKKTLKKPAVKPAKVAVDTVAKEEFTKVKISTNVGDVKYACIIKHPNTGTILLNLSMNIFMIAFYFIGLLKGL